MNCYIWSLSQASMTTPFPTPTPHLVLWSSTIFVFLWMGQVPPPPWCYVFSLTQFPFVFSLSGKPRLILQEKSTNMLVSFHSWVTRCHAHVFTCLLPMSYSLPFSLFHTRWIWSSESSWENPETLSRNWNRKAALMLLVSWLTKRKSLLVDQKSGWKQKLKPL